MIPQDMHGNMPTFDLKDLIGFAIWFHQMDPQWDVVLELWFVELDIFDVDVDLQPAEQKGYTDDGLLNEYLRTQL